MCLDHSGVLVEIATASVRGPDGKMRGIDACIAPLVKVLNDVGIGTRSSCCGHGRQLGSVALADGRELIIAPDSSTARRIDQLMDDRAGAADLPPNQIARPSI